MLLDSELKKQTDTAKTQYQGLDKVYKLENGERINNDDKKPTLKKYNKSNLIYDSNHTFYKYHNIK